jgi:hypothetical protein
MRFAEQTPPIWAGCSSPATAPRRSWGLSGGEAARRLIAGSDAEHLDRCGDDHLNAKHLMRQARNERRNAKLRDSKTRG